MEREARSVLLEELRIGALRAKNRLVAAATHTGLAGADGRVTPELLARYEEFARGGAGTVITGYAYVVDHGIANPRMLAADDDACTRGLSELAARGHDCGARMILQLAYGGSKCGVVPAPAGILGPSAVANPKTGVVPAEATAEQLSQVASAFAQAARRAKAAGFDGVEVHAAHGYLLSQFLDPRFNKREDEYGGALENRARLACEVVRAVRDETGEDFPVFAKLNSSDGAAGGMSEAEARVAARMLVAAGASAIEVSGPWHDLRVSPAGGPLFADFARRLAGELDVPVIVTGGCRDASALERLARAGVAGFGLCRPLICEPDLPARWLEALRRGEKPASPRCVSCNACCKTEGCRCVLAAR